MNRSRLACVLGFLCALGQAHAQPLTTAFTYQCNLSTAGSPATGPFDLRFRLYDATSGSTQIGPTLCSDNLPVTSGIGAPMPLLHVATEISEQALDDGAKAEPDAPVPTCSFTIAGGAPNSKVSWRVEAHRNDRWVQAYGAPVEVSKEASEDGTYQQPALYPQK